MTALGAAAVGVVGFVTMRLGRGTTAGTQIALSGAADELRMIPRSDWGAADPAVSETGFGEHGFYNAVTNTNGWMVYNEALDQLLNQVIIHHSALPLTDGPLEIQRLHMQDRDFADVGYHYIIDYSGKLYEGRPLNVRGAHTYGMNYASVGICLLGNFEEIQPDPAQLTTLRALLAGLVRHFPQIARLGGHRDYNDNTVCPGANLYPLLPGIAEELGLTYVG